MNRSVLRLMSGDGPEPSTVAEALARDDIPAEVRELIARLAAEREALIAPAELLRSRLRNAIVAVAGSSGMAEAQSQLLAAALELTGLEAGGVYGVEGDWLVLTEHAGLPDGFAEMVERMPLDSPVVQMALADPWPLDLVARCGPLLSLNSRFGLCCAYAVAILARDEVVGFVNVASKLRTEPQPFGLEALAALAAETGSVLMRLRAEEAAERGRAMLRGVLDAIPDAVFVKDTEGRYRAVNPAFERLSGRSAETIVGATAADLFRPDVAARFAEVDSEVLASGRMREVAEEVLVDDQTQAITETRKSALRDEQGKVIGVVGVARDIRRRHRAQSLRDARLRLLEYAQTHTLRELMVATLDAAESLTGSSIGYCQLVEDDELAASLHAWSTATAAQCAAHGAQVHHGTTVSGAWRRCVSEQRPVVCNGEEADRAKRVLPRGHLDTARELIVPVLRNGRVVAVLGVGNKPVPYVDDDVDTVLQLADVAWEIAAWRRAEDARGASERRLAMLVANVRDVLFELDSAANITYVSDAVQDLLGHPPSELMGRPVWSLMPPEDRATEAQRLQVAEACARSERLEARLVHRDGHCIWAEIIGNAMRGEQGDVQSVLGVARDITERRSAERATAASEARFRVLVENSPEAIVVHRDGQVLLVNAAALALFGADHADQLLGRPVLEMVHPDYHAIVKSRMRLLRDADSAPPTEETLLRLDGTLIEAEVSGARVILDGQPAVQLVLRDTGQRKLIERLLRATVESTAQTTGSSFFGTLTMALADALNCTGCFVAELVDGRLRTLANVVDGEPNPAQELPLEGTPWEELTALGVMSVATGGADRWPAALCLQRLGSFTAAVLPGSDGEPLGVITVWHSAAILSPAQIEPLLRICAARAGAELERLRTLNELRHLVTAMDQAGESILITDFRGCIQYVNPAFERLTGYSREEALGQNPRLLNSGEQAAEFYEEMWRTISSGSVWSGRIVDRHRDGHRVTSEMTVAPVLDRVGQISRYVAVQRDVSREVALEAELRQAQKMEAVGQLAGGVAHDLNNVLTPILGYAEMSLSEMGADDPRRHGVDQIISASHRARDLVKQLLAFSRQQTLVVQTIDLNDVVHSFQPLLRRSLREDIELTAHCPAMPLWIHADRGQIEQVLLNLALNAQDAMPEGGRLTLSTAPRRITTRSGWLPPGDYVALVVSDSGCGMEASTVERIFEPFYSTKGDRGTGLGLATSLGIVQQHRGDIEVDSQPGVGTTFTIWLPASAAETDDRRPSSAATVAKGDGLTVLVAEDEPAVRSLAVRMCRHLGYHAITAETPEACLELARHEEIDILFSDVVMPRLNGRQLAEQVRALHPDVRVLLASGYARDVLGERAQLGERDGFIGKPYELAGLAEALRRLIDAP